VGCRCNLISVIEGNAVRLLRLRFRSLFRRRTVENELDEELRFHLALQVEANLAAGMSPGDACRAALRNFDGLTQSREKCRDARRMNMLDNFMRDLRYALRGLRRDRVLTVTATLTLAACIGANTTIFSLVDSILLRPLPYPGSDRLCWVTERMGRQQTEIVTGADYYSVRAENRAFEDVAAFDGATVSWTGPEKAEQLDAAQVTPSFFHVLGTQPMMGRYLAAGEEGPKAPPVVVLSYALWRSRFGSDPHIVGKSIVVDRLPATIVGVMPQGFDYPRGTKLWSPMAMDEASQLPRLATRPMRLVDVIAKLKPGVTRAQVDTELKRLASDIRGQYPKEFLAGGFLNGMMILARPLQDVMVGNLRPALLALSGGVGLLLLIACVNVANLMLARSAARQREAAVRLALGCDRWRVMRQVLTESMALAIPGGVAGVLIAIGAVRLLNAWQPLVLTNYPPVSLDLPVLLFTFGLSVMTGLLFGVAPAFATARTSVQDALRGAGSTLSGGRGTARLRRVLVVMELAISLMLLIGAGLLGRSFIRLAATPLGFRSENLLTFRLNLTGAQYNTGIKQIAFYDDLLPQLRRLPGVTAAAYTTTMPLSGGAYSRMRFRVLGAAPLPLAQRPETELAVVSPSFFRTMGIPMRGGRTFDAQDSRNSPTTIIVNEAFARRIFHGRSAIGQRIASGPNDRKAYTIAGVVGDVRGAELGVEPGPLAYECSCQANSPFETRMVVSLRTTGDPRDSISGVEGQVRAIDRDLPVYDVKTMDQRLADSLAPQRFNLMLIGVFAVLAILLAAMGIYGVMSWLVARRTREIGIRIALGARREQVLGLILSESAALTVFAVIAGLAGAWGLTRYLKSMLYGVTALDAVTFVLMPAVLVAIALFASAAPAMRASRVDPASTLREE